MMKFLQKLGKSLMLPVACLPVASIMMGLGYWIDPIGWGANNVFAAFLLKGGGALIENMAILFAVGVAVGMSQDNDGTSGLAGLVSWLVMTTLLAPGSVAFFQGVDISEVNSAFGKIQNQFIGIVAGLIAAYSYNKFKNTRLPDALAFFSGKRSVAIVTASISALVSAVLFFLWPMIYTALVGVGTSIVNTGAVGAGIYGFLNRLLLPTGLHHALNSVFWFDVAGINDLSNFWSGDGVLGETGMYMTGYFPVMMFGLPAGALAMYHTAKSNKQKAVYGILLAGSISSFFTGVTEPLEFAFMFVAPPLYLLHSILSGVSGFVMAVLPIRAGFNFSAGFVDFFLSFKAPMALNPIMIIPIGLAFGCVYYFSFKTLILAMDLKTPGREDDNVEEEKKVSIKNDDFVELASEILEGLGGKENVSEISNCITRLRLEVKDITKVDDKKIKATGVAGVLKPGKTSVQIVVGAKVQFVADELNNLCK